MDGAARGPAAADEILAWLPFVDPEGGAPVNYYHAPERNTGRYAPVRVAVRNGRRLGAPTSLDREGFVFRHAPTSFRDFYDPAQVRERYYPEVAALLQAQTGATSVLVYEHVVRGDAVGQRGAAQVRAPAGFMHADFTPEAAPKRVRELLPAAEAERLLAHRVLQLNVWRPIRGPLRTRPLAVCDAASLQPDDFLLALNYTPSLVNAFFVVKHRPGQRWIYFPEMQTDEVVFLKNFDSAGSPIGAHGAMDDPTTPPDAAPRESIEARAFVFFAPA